MSAIWNRMHSGIAARLTRNWPVNGFASQAKTPFVSFSFDDFPHSAACEGAEILACRSIRATYFVSGARMGRNVEGLDHFTHRDLVELSGEGHEIGCHTFSHIRLPAASSAEIRAEIARNRAFILEYAKSPAPKSFAYPFGAVSFRTKQLVARHFPICRSIDWGINRGFIDFGQLKAVLLTELRGHADIARLFDQTRAANGWLIFFTHDVSREPNEHGCSPARLAAVANEALERGMTVLPICQVAENIRISRDVASVPASVAIAPEEMQASTLR
ncbi:MAG TPA: polysaccharide deacetylase family protein [Rhizomicrobium sp.]|nr:polysaccharide deacetylase family protein [Rhizomicrobium sp.]